MKILIHAAFLAALVSSTVVLADTKSGIRDLGPNTTVKLNVELKVMPNDHGGTDVYAQVENPFTNPIICALDLALPTRRYGHDGVFNLSQSDMLVFPKGTFDDETFSQIILSGFPANTDVAAVSGTRLAKSASCRGWSLGKRLPRRTCLQLAPTYEQSCVAALSADMNYIPLVRGHLHLGDCGC